MSAKHILVGGGTGFIGTKLCQHLRTKGYDVTVVSRMPGTKRITWHELEKTGLPNTVTDVVNLAGQNVLDPTRRWTPGFKQNVWNSRVNTASSMVKAITKSSNVKSFVNICGVSGYRPNQKIYSEDDRLENFDFMSSLCIEIEKSATLPSSQKQESGNGQEQNCRNIKIRTGVVLGRDGGMIKSIYLPFWLGLGGPMGNGDQILPWIHLNDLCHLITFCIENKKMNGVVNGVAPEIVTNKDFSKIFASSLGRPSLFPVPEFVVNLVFGKERAVLILTGAKIKPKRALEAGFEFKYATVKSACDEIVGKKI